MDAESKPSTLAAFMSECQVYFRSLFGQSVLNNQITDLKLITPFKWFMVLFEKLLTKVENLINLR